MSIDAQANLRTLRDVLRFAVTRFSEAGVFFGHGQADAFDEAAFLVMRSLRLPLERLDVFLGAYLTHGEINTLLQQIDLRVKKRLPAAYILKEAWLQGLKFYVDERVIVPRSFIGELLRDGGRLLRVCAVILGQQLELHFLAADRHAFRVQHINRHPCAVFVVLAEVGNRTGQRADMADLHDGLLRAGLSGDQGEQGKAGGGKAH